MTNDAAKMGEVGKTGLYVYGILSRSAALPLDALDGGDLGGGIAGSPVRLLQAGPLTALVSAVVPGPIGQTRRNMISHTAVLERAIARADVLPVRFGTVAPNEAAVTRCITVHATDIQSALGEIDGRVELGVKASWREGVVFGEIAAADTEICRLRDRLRSRPSGETYYERVELGRRVEAALAGRRAAETAAIVGQLTPLAERDVELRTLDEDMILNRAFLVKRENEAAFDARIEAVAERCAGRMTFRYVGPVPPYNFVRLQVGWLAGAA